MITRQDLRGFETQMLRNDVARVTWNGEVTRAERQFKPVPGGQAPQLGRYLDPKSMNEGPLPDKVRKMGQLDMTG